MVKSPVFNLNHSLLNKSKILKQFSPELTFASRVQSEIMVEGGLG